MPGWEKLCLWLFSKIRIENFFLIGARLNGFRACFDKGTPFRVEMGATKDRDYLNKNRAEMRPSHLIRNWGLFWAILLFKSTFSTQ